ncbi:hypothetical protein ACF065_25160 [Streptomyces sp. NPDC015232]|uniref:hypothetical protein n=1 Tax=unclassified Streptomyces TaxID=2593676 RepID=UPI003700621B
MTRTQVGAVGRLLRAMIGTVPEREPEPEGAGREGGGALGAVERTRPARGVAAGVAAAGGADVEAAGLLGELTESHLGADPDRWCALHDALATYRGELPALLADLPAPTPAADGEVRPPAPRSVHRTLGLLLEHAEPRHAATALAALPERVTAELLAGGSLPAPALVTAVVEHGDTRTRAALARHPRLDARDLARLAALGDARVTAAVYRNPRTTPSLRRTIAERIYTVPLDDTLRAELTAPHGRVPRSWLAPLLCTGDPALVLPALRCGVRRTAQQYALLRIWERGGPDAVRALLDTPDARPVLHRDVVDTVTEALAAPDGDGPRRLRAQGEPYEDPDRLPALLATARGTTTLRDLLTEPYAHDIDALAAAHAKSPFMPKACEELARHEAASDEQRRAFRLGVLNEPWRAGGRRAGNTTPPARRLAAEELDDSAPDWAEGMAAAGLLDPLDLVRTARPAGHALAALARLAERDLLGARATAELRGLTDTHLGEREEAWAALDAVLPEQRGTVAELVAEAGKTAHETLPAPAPAHEAPAHEAPAHEAPAHEAPAREAPAHEAPAHEAPAREAPEDEAPVREALAHEAPAHGPAARPEDRPAAVPPPPPQPSAPASPRPFRRGDRVLALAALDLLLSLAPDDAPRPTDPEVLRALTVHEPATAPGLATPAWFAAACAARGIPASEDGHAHEAPDPADVRSPLPETYGSGAQHFERAYAQGVLPAEELLAVLPARRLLLLPYDWQRLAFADAWRAALARRLRTALGTDPEAWLRLAATVTASEAVAEDLTWTELLERALSDARRAPAPAPVTVIGRPRPTTPDEAIDLLAHGDHLWGWPEGTLLCLADPEVIAAVLPRLGPDGPWLLAAYLLRHDRTPRAALDRLLADRDPEALRVLAAQSRWMERSGAVRHLVDLDDPEVDLALLRHGVSRTLVPRIVSRSRPGGGRPSLGARVLADWRAGGAAWPAGGTAWLCSAEPDLVEALLDASGSRLGLAEQLLGCLRLFEHGGPERLARLAARSALGRSATTVCAKALASADPAAVLRARLDRELAPDKLVRKLRRSRSAAHTRDLVASLPPGEPVDWAALEAAHAEEPLPHWQELVRLDGVPEDVRLRHAALLPEPGPDGLHGSARLTRERARYGLGGLYRHAPSTQLDGLLAAGLLDAPDLVRLVTPAARLLAYLGAAARRTDAPPQTAEARTLLADLVRSRLGTDPAAWHRVAERLTGLDPAWDPDSTVEALLTA